MLSLVSIQGSCDALLTKHFPALVAADDEAALRDVLTDIGEELVHLVYHARDARYLQVYVDRVETMREEHP